MGIYGFDAFSPAEIIAKVESVGVNKARLPIGSMLMLSVLAGAFIGMGEWVPCITCWFGPIPRWGLRRAKC